jgi:hypothetical protein
MDPVIEDALCDLRAQVHVQRIAMRALARAHPDPGGLLAAWREALADAAANGPVDLHARRSAVLAERCRTFAEDWTAEFVELAVPSRHG